MEFIEIIILFVRKICARRFYAVAGLLIGPIQVAEVVNELITSSARSKTLPVYSVLAQGHYCYLPNWGVFFDMMI